MINNAFTTQNTYDGLSWINNAHKIGLSTIDNLITGALTDANFEAACTRLESFVVKPDKISKPRPLNGNSQKKVLLVPPGLGPTAKRIIKRRVVDENQAGVDNINFEAAEIIISSYLTDADGWFLFNCGGPLKPIFLQERKPLEFRNLTPKDSDLSFINDEFVYGAKTRMACCPTYPWLVVGSTGA